MLPTKNNLITYKNRPIKTHTRKVVRRAENQNRSKQTLCYAELISQINAQKARLFHRSAQAEESFRSAEQGLFLPLPRRSFFAKLAPNRLRGYFITGLFLFVVSGVTTQLIFSLLN